MAKQEDKRELKDHCRELKPLLDEFEVLQGRINKVMNKLLPQGGQDIG